MKQNGLIGLGSGRLGTTISSVRGGVQIQRERRTSIANPNTPGQVAQRARIKLMSQLGAALNSIIAIPAFKTHTSRNLFSKANIDNVVVQDDVASIDFRKIQLTSSSFGCPAVVIERTQMSGLQVYLASDGRACCNRVVYCLVKVTDSGALSVVDTRVANAAGPDGLFPESFEYVSGQIIVYAYGIRFNTAKAAARYGGYNISTGQGVASLIISRKIALPDFRVTATVAASIVRDTDLPRVDDVNSVPVTGPSVVIGNVNPAVTMTGVNFANHQFELWDSEDGTSLTDGVVMSDGTECVFNFMDVGTFFIKCDGEIMFKLTISPYACFIENVNGVPASIGNYAEVPRNGGRIVVNGYGFNGSWMLQGTGSPGYAGIGEISRDRKTVTFTNAPAARLELKCENIIMLYIHVLS